ncbi:MAG: hypothetical protein U9P49_11480 [Thermodesulfobacteriota bacterium]|nr:hypothetical protein [Thermodesulfobacteriota bacterium]
MKLFFSHSWKPILILLIITSVSFVLYEYSIFLSPQWLHKWIAGISGFILFLCIGFGALYVYTYSYKQGASLAEKIIASYGVPFLWAVKEVIRISVAFTIFESLYFYCSPLITGVFFGVLSEIGFVELICRKKYPSKRSQTKANPIIPLCAFIGGLSVVVFILAWGKGEYTFYIFLRGFRALFGPGQGVE